MADKDQMPAATGLWRENVRQAFGVIRANRMRSGLLILGVGIGVTTVLMMVTVLSGLSGKIYSDLVSANRPYVYVQRFDLMGSAQDEAMLRREALTRDDAAAIKHDCPSVEDVCFLVQPQRSFVVRRGSEKTPPTQMAATAASFPVIYSLPIGNGRYFTGEEETLRRRVVVLGFGPAQDLFGEGDPVGEWVRIAGRRYKVVGAFANRHHIAGSFSNNFIVIPQTTYQKDFEGKSDLESISVTVRPGRTLADGVEDVTHVLRARRGVGPGKKNDFEIQTSESFVDLVRRVTVPISLVLTVIASIGLVVGGIGVMNIMLISVAERTREIGVRMAIGARREHILSQFLVESATLTGIGGVIGTVVGTTLAWGVSHLIHFPFRFSVPWTLTAVLFSAAVGVVFGLYPARRAARMDPVVALRHE